MSNRHLFNSPIGLVNKSLRGIIAYNPHLSFNEDDRVVFDTRHEKAKISIISGGGSGHEPAWSGYVGTNMLTASVAGDIFASPSTRQILSAIEAVPSDAGCLLVITNYTGDCLHFGLAVEKALARGRNCRMVVCGDDVSIEKSQGKLVGRRGLAGQIAVLKIAGAAANAAKASFTAICDLTEAVANQIVSIAATIDHCHVPGRTEHAQLDIGAIELGTGPHNEPGHERLSPAPSPGDLIDKMLRYCLDPKDTERAYVHFDSDHETVLVVNNFGGMSCLEMGALVDEVLVQLVRKWHIKPARIFAGCLESSLNAPAFSISLINISAASKNCAFTVDQIKGFLDERTDTCWEAVAGCQTRRRPREAQVVQQKDPKFRREGLRADLRMEPSKLERMIRSACTLVIEAEPDLTKWDTIMGDGDCGETFKTGSLTLLDALDNKAIASRGSILDVLHEIEEIVETKMGGTLGGLLGIFFVSLTDAVRRLVLGGKMETPSDVWAPALPTALERLQRYSRAREGDRTIMDVLEPFVAAMQSKEFDAAVEAAIRGAEATKKLKPRFGRATYVTIDDQEYDALPPDPGAWGAMCVLKGLRDGLL